MHKQKKKQGSFYHLDKNINSNYAIMLSIMLWENKIYIHTEYN
jgi:hypothetical protein